MLKSPILLTLLSCGLLPGKAFAFGVGGGALTSIQDLQTHLPVIHQTVSSAFSAISPTTTTGMLDTVHSFSHSISSITSTTAATTTNNILASSVVETSPTDIAASLMSDYRKALDADPLRTKIITGCLLAIVGDAIAQLTKPEEYDPKRAVAFVMFDGVWRTVQQVTYGPIIQTCNGKFTMGLLGSLPFVNNIMQDQLKDSILVLGAIEQTLVSQLILIPLLYYPIFYSVTGFVQSLTVEETLTRAKETFIPLMKRNLLFWIPVQFYAFDYVEENLQIPVLTACGLVWTVILSLSAGNVSSSAEEENLDPELSATEGAAGLSGSWSNVTSSYDGSEYDLTKSSTIPANEKSNENNKVESTLK